jgi:hypothetical protein
VELETPVVEGFVTAVVWTGLTWVAEGGGVVEAVTAGSGDDEEVVAVVVVVAGMDGLGLGEGLGLGVGVGRAVAAGAGFVEYTWRPIATNRATSDMATAKVTSVRTRVRRSMPSV